MGVQFCPIPPLLPPKIGLKEVNSLCKHMKNVRSSQSCISMNSCTEFSKVQDFPWEYR